MIITITAVSQAFTANGDEYKKITGISDGRETTKSVFNQLEGKWPLLVDGATLEFKMEKHGQFWNVKDILEVGDLLPPPVSAGAVPVPKTPAEPAPQAVGMLTKEIGDMIRAEKLSVVFGSIIANKLTEWYRSQVLGISRVSWDGKDLPKFK